MTARPPIILLLVASQTFCVAALFRPNHAGDVNTWRRSNGCTDTDTPSCNSGSSSMVRGFSNEWLLGDKCQIRRQHHHRKQPMMAFVHQSARSRLLQSSTQSNHDACRASTIATGGMQQQQLKPKIRTSSSLSMSLIPIPVNELQDILPTPSKLTPNGDQYVSYFGRTPQQRFNSLFEGVSIAFLGSMFAYFLSFVIGQFLATLLGVIFLFWPILSPEFKAYQRNWELVGGRGLVDVWMDDEESNNPFWSGLPEDKRGVYGGYYVTRVEDVCVVDDVRASTEEEYDLEEFSGYTMAQDELESVTGLPWKLRLRLLDEEGRGMQVHSRLSEDYLGIEPGMNAVGVLLSTSKGFGELAGMTDFCVLDEVNGEAVAWVGDYPYLDKDLFLRTINDNGVSDSLLEFEDGVDDVQGMYGSEEEEIGEEETEEEYITVR